MTTINHRAFRNTIRHLPGYRALSDAIKTDIEFAAPKVVDKAATLNLKDLDAAYLGWVRIKREAVRKILWQEAAHVILGKDASGITYLNSAIYGAALAMSKDETAVSAAKAALGYMQDEDEADEADEADDADGDDGAENEEVWM